MRFLVLIALVISVFMALSLVFFQATRKTYPGFSLWTAGVGLLGLGYLSWCLRGVVPDAVSILLLNASYPTGMVMHLAGMRRFLGLTPISRLWWALPAGNVIVAAALYYGYDSIALRSLFASIATSMPHFAMAFLILARPVRSRSIFFVVIGLMLAAGGAAILGRAIWLVAQPEFHMFLDSPVQVIFFVGVIVLQLGENLAFIMLNSERVENELLEAQAGLRRTVEELRSAMFEIKTLTGFLPICSNCKKIRDDQGYWQAVEKYIQEHSEAKLSHGICPDCLRNLYPDFADEILNESTDLDKKSKS
jgi:hypothetical protein